MEEKNYEYLTGQVKSLGFGDKKKEEIKAALQTGKTEVHVIQQGEFKRPDGVIDKMEFDLQFNKSTASEKYFLNQYTATLIKNELRGEDQVKTFYIRGYDKDFPDAKVDITSREAYNLLDSRYVLKDRIKTDKDTGKSTQYPAWPYLDFAQKDDRNQPKLAQYHGDYFDLNEVIKAYPIKGKDNMQVMDDLFYNLEKGNLTQVTFSVNGKEETKYVSANPRYKNLDVYDENMVKERQGQQHRESRTLHKGESRDETTKKNELSSDQQVDESKKKGHRVHR